MSHTRIGIIGAGPGGLAAAEALAEKGYTDITILEKRSAVGGQGQSASFTTPDGRELIYEMGSVQPMMTPSIKHLIQKYDLHMGKGPSKKQRKWLRYYHPDKGIVVDTTKAYPYGPLSTLPDVLHDLYKLAGILWKYRAFRRPGYYQRPIPEELMQPAMKWLESLEFKVIHQNISFSLGTLSSGGILQLAYESLPAIRVVKFLYQMLNWPIRYADGTYQPIEEGIQAIWKAVAQEKNVMDNAQIQSIERAEVITVTTKEQTYTFDKLIITCPLTFIREALTPTPIEQRMANEVVFCPLWKCAFIASGLPHDAIYNMLDVFSESEDRNRLGIFIPEDRVDESQYLYTAAICHPQAQGFDPIKEKVERYVQTHFHATIHEWVNERFWPEYNAHYPCSSLQTGIYEQIETAQGEQNTYYAGSLCDINGHGCVSEYSFDLVERFF